MSDQDERKNEQQEVGLYETLARRTAELLESGKKTLDEALRKAKEELASAGDFSREQAESVSAYVRRDLAQLAEQAGQVRESLKKTADPQRVATGIQSVFARILSGAAETLSELAARAELQLEHRTGEVTSPGTLTCKDCGAEMKLTATVRIPPCPKCAKTAFRKSY
jgi:hypothetical protein